LLGVEDLIANEHRRQDPDDPFEGCPFDPEDVWADADQDDPEKRSGG
jgi:hypothetical protein